MVFEIGLTIKDLNDSSDVGAMDYAQMHVINSPPQDTRARNVSTTDEHQHLSHDQELDDEIMVTKENAQTLLVGVLPHQEDTEDSDMEHSSDRVINDTVKSANVVETKIKLNFSVDRLLGADCGDSARNHRIMISTKNNNNNNGGGTLSHGQYDCCKYLRNGHQSHLDGYHIVKHNQIPSHRGHHEGGILLPPSMDIKAVVRPTPIRALGTGSDEVLSYSSMASSILKFHQHQQHQHHHQQQPPSASIAALSSLMAPFNGLKSLQINQQHFRQQANIQSSGKSLDIPPTTQAAGGCVSGSTVSTVSTASSGVIANSGKRKRSWSRAVFSNLQRKGLEIQFQQQKYITKPDRRKLAARLNLTDAQVKVWFQNRRMKWRHTRENLKSGQEKPVSSQSAPAGATSTSTAGGIDTQSGEKRCYTSSSDSDDDEIDVVE